MLGIDFQQILLHLLNVVILFFVLYFLLYKPVCKFMDQREQHYKEIDEKAKKNLADAEQSKEEYRRKLEAASEEISAMKEKSRKEISEEKNARLAKAESDAAEILEKAQKKAKAEHDQIIGSAQKEISELVTDATEKIVLHESVSDSYDQFLNSAESDEGEQANES
ncbi:MAG: ATP synthase F0 subunit B [Bilifractor sp.]|jgi:F-type H+-transporting ATPase subunit b